MKTRDFSIWRAAWSGLSISFLRIHIILIFFITFSLVVVPVLLFLYLLFPGFLLYKRILMLLSYSYFSLYFPGLIRVVLDMYDGVKGRGFEFIYQFPKYPHFFSAAVVFFLPSVIYLLDSFFQFPKGFLFLFLVVVSVIWQSRLCFFPFFIADEGLNGWESLKRSFFLTRGLKKKMVGIYVVSSLFLAIPFIGVFVQQLMLVSAYRFIKKV